MNDLTEIIYIRTRVRISFDTAEGRKDAIQCAKRHTLDSRTMSSSFETQPLTSMQIKKGKPNG